MAQLAQYISLYVIYTLPLYIIAKKSEHPLAWLAWVPFADLWLMCDMADKDTWWLALLCLPPISIVAYVLIWCALAENTNKPAWLGILMIVPVVNIFVGYYMAVYEPNVG